MRHLILCALSALILFSCRKNAIENNVSGYSETVKTHLKDSLSVGDFANLNFEDALRTSVDSVDLYTVRIPFKGRKIDEYFVLLHTDQKGRIIEGRIVDLAGTVSENGAAKSYNGNITLSSLNRKTVVHSRIINGFVEAFLPDQSSQRGMLMEPTTGLLPEVVVVGYLNSGSSGISFSTWMALMNLFNNSNSWQCYNYYSALDPTYNSSSTSSGGGGSTGGSWSYSTPLAIDFENQYSQPAIDLQKYINCFNAIPDAGANCSIEIFSDIPVDNDSYKLFDWQAGSPGHTFIQIRKANNGQVVQQSIGFYPESAWKTALTNAPINGKFVDNGGHEFNASMRMNLTPEQLKLVLAEMQYLQNVKYDIDEYNCTDWALDVFNRVRSHIVQIPRYHIPGGMTAGGTSTPQGLYNWLRQTKDSGGAEAGNITIGFYKGYVNGSKGPCN